MRYLILAAVLYALPASAQLSLSADTYTPTAFGSGLATALEGAATIYSTDALGLSDADAARIDALIGQTGAGQTWDFTALTFLDQTLEVEGRRVDDPSSLPGANLFPSATVAYASNFRGFADPGGVTYTFARVSDDAFVTLGSFIEAAGPGELRKVYVPDGLVHATFPLALGASFEDGSVYDSSPRTAAGPDSVGVAVEVVGSGTLMIEGGSYDALLIRRTETDYERDGSRTIAYDPITTHEWVTADGVAALAGSNEIGPDRRIVRFAQYQVPGFVTALEDAPQPLALTVAPNPTASASTVRLAALEAGPARVEVYDALGRTVVVLHDGTLGAGDHAFSTPGLAPGLYVVRVEADGQTASASIVVAR